MTDLRCLGFIQSRFRLFWHDSRLIWSVLAVSVGFGYQPIRSDFGRIDANRPKLKPSWRESKKKNSNVASTHRQPHRWLHPTSGCVRLRCGTLPAASELPSFFSFVYCFLWFLSYKLVSNKDYACHVSLYDLKTIEVLWCCCWRCDHIGRPYKICGIHSTICRVRVVHGSSCKTWRISMDVLEAHQNLMAHWRIRLVPQFGSHSPLYSLLIVSTNVYNLFFFFFFFNYYYYYYKWWVHKNH